MDTNLDTNLDTDSIESENQESKESNTGLGVKWTRISIKDDVWTLLKEVAQEKGMSVTDLADEAFSLYFNIPSKEKKEKKEKSQKKILDKKDKAG